MRLTLRLSGGVTSAEGQLYIARMDPSGAPCLVGRSPNADWTLVDPSNRISGIHLEFRREGDDLLLIDRSSGGTSLDQPANRLQRGQPIRLPDSAALYMPVGVVTLTIDRGDNALPAPGLSTAEDVFAIGELQRQRPGRGQLLFDDDQGAQPEDLLEQTMSGPPANRSALPDPGDLLSGAPATAPLRRPAEPALNVPPSSAPLPPAGHPVSRATQPQAASAPAPMVRTPAPDPIGDAWLDEDQDDDIFGPPPDEFIDEPIQETVAEPADPLAEIPKPAPDAPAPSMPIDPALRRMFHQLGLDAEAMTPEERIEVAAEIADIFAAMADAMQLMLKTRARVKHSLGIAATEVQHGANPLKSVQNREAAVQCLLRPLASGYLSGEVAVNDALHTMERHQHAMVTGIKAAMHTALKAFDPAKLEGQLEHGSMSRLVPAMRKAALWENFETNYAQFAEQAHENFRMMIGQELDRLYEIELDPVTRSARHHDDP